MKNKTPIILSLTILIVTLACGLPAMPTLVPASTPPALPQYVPPTPTPTYAPISNLNPGDSITITDGSGKFLWLEYLGNVGGYDSWNCKSNAPGKENDCQSSDLEVHQTHFYWDTKAVAFNGDGGGDIVLYDNWHIATPADKPMLP